MRAAILPLLFLLLLALLPAEAMADKLQKPGRLRSVQAEFVQEKHLKILTRPLVSRGTFAFQAPQSLRWEYRSPFAPSCSCTAPKSKNWWNGTAGLRRRPAWAWIPC